MIKRFIEQRIGFERFDHLLLAGAKQSFTRAAIMRHRRKCCNLGRFCAPSLESFNAHLERRSDCWTNDAFEIRTSLMGHATFEMGSCCKYECCPRHGCCGRCCEMLIVVGCCNGCCVWGGLSESVAALCCFFLCCPTQYQDEDVRTVGELCVRCARCWSPWNVERLLGVHNCRNVLGCWAYDERLDCICHCGGDGCPQSCCCGAESVCAPRVQLHDREKQEMEELAKRKKESKSKMSKEDEARLKELKRLQKEAGLTKLIDLFLNNNQLSGAIPDTLANCRALQRVDLTNNRLTGTVPPAWPKLEARVKEQWPKLEFFKLFNNELEQNARDGDEYWKHVVDESRQEALDHARDQEYIQATNEYQSKWRTVRLEQSFALS